MRLRHLAAFLIPLTFAGCLGDPVDPSANYPLVPIENTTFAAGLNVKLAESIKTASGLYYRDVTEGTGKVVANGDSLNVKYAGYLANGQLFDSGTFPLRLPAQVIAGWNEGLLGMKVGGVRQLIIPPSLAYGSQGSYPVIPPNAVLVFTVNPI